MPDSLTPAAQKGAVFLSYASQDAEAAKRICEALRTAGIEVWFDQSELRGGDAWDANIRRQIKECALFMPVISATTQERPEGYFRLEWHLAEQRTYLMAHDQPFLVPVVVDDTPDAAARVPERFRERQWTHLKGGETPAAFCDRVKKLLGGSGGAPPRIHPESRGSAAPAGGKAAAPPAGRGHPWALPVTIGLVVVLLVTCMLRPRHSPKEIADLVAMAQKFSEPTAAPVSEAQQLLAKAWEQLNKTELGPEELAIADGFCKRASELDPTDAEVWAAWSQVDSWYIYHNFDRSAERQEAARANADRSLRLAPDSYESRLAQACYLVRGGCNFQVPTFAKEADKTLRQLLQEKIDEPRALFALAILQRNLGRLDDARITFKRLAQNPDFAATAWSELAWLEYFFGGFKSAAEGPLNRSLAIRPFYGNLFLRVYMAYGWYGDMASAKEALDQVPASALQTDFGVSMAEVVYSYRREPEEFLNFMKDVRRDWLHSKSHDGPTAYWLGKAQKMAGRNDAARIEWQTALALVERRLADQPTDAGLLEWKGKLLTSLGEYSEAEKALKEAAELDERKTDLFDLELAKGQQDEAMDLLESWQLNAAYLRLDPAYDPLRKTPRF